jgi:hypothetical protein
MSLSGLHIYIIVPMPFLAHVLVLSFRDCSLRSDFVVSSVLCTHTLEPALFLDADSPVISAKYPVHYLITLDEVSKDHRTYTRTREGLLVVSEWRSIIHLFGKKDPRC